MYCSNCKKQIEDNSVKFCPNCGSKIIVARVREQELSKTKKDTWSSYQNNAKFIIFINFIFWIAGKSNEEIAIFGLMPTVILFYLTGKQIKKDTNSKWSYWCGALVIFFWGLGGYYGAKEFHEKGEVHLVGKILTIIAYLLIGFFIYLPFYL